MRKPRLNFQGGLYHLIVRGNHRQRVFLDEAAQLRYLTLLGKKASECHIALYAYCLMPNHVHLLAEQRGTTTLSKFMQKLQTAYTVWFNLRHKKAGHLFQGRFMAHLVDRTSYFQELIRYIHLNPFRAGLEKKLGRYPWTSHAQYMGLERKSLAPVQVATALGVFHLRSRLARRAYLRFFREGMGDGSKPELYKVFGGRILGDDQFARKTLEKRGETFEKPRQFKRLDMSQIAVAIAEREGLADRATLNPIPKAFRPEAAYLAMEVAGIRQATVGTYLGVSQGAVSQAANRFRCKLQEDEKKAKDWWVWVESWAKKEPISA